MRSLPLHAALLLLLAGTAEGQTIPRGSYHDHIPPMSRLVGQTTPNLHFSLYGDRAALDYTDADPVDGIDDRRGRILNDLSVRFSPVLRRNNFSAPRDFRRS